VVRLVTFAWIAGYSETIHLDVYGLTLPLACHHHNPHYADGLAHTNESIVAEYEEREE
jgi:hypothetical protein